MTRRYTIRVLLFLFFAAGITLPATAQNWIRLVNLTRSYDSVRVSLLSSQLFPPLSAIPRTATRPLYLEQGEYVFVVHGYNSRAGEWYTELGRDTIQAVGDDTFYTMVVNEGHLPFLTLEHHNRYGKPDSAYVRTVNLVENSERVSCSYAAFGLNGGFVRQSGMKFAQVSSYRPMPAGDIQMTVVPEGGRRFAQLMQQVRGATLTTVIVTGTYDSTDLHRMMVFVLDDSEFLHGQGMVQSPFNLTGHGLLRYANVLPDEAEHPAVVAAEVPADTMRLPSGFAAGVRSDIGGPVRFDLVGAGSKPVLSVVHPMVPGNVNTAILHLDSLEQGPVISMLTSDIYNHPWTFGYTTVRIFAATGALVDAKISIAQSGAGPAGTTQFPMLRYAGATTYRQCVGGWTRLTIEYPDGTVHTYSGVLPLQGLVTLIVAGDPRISANNCTIFTYDERDISHRGQMLTWSHVAGVSAAEESPAGLRVLPNPASGPARLLFTAMRPGPARIAIVDNGGREVMRDRIQCTGAEQWYDIPAGALAQGVYTATVLDDTGVQFGSARFVLRH